MRASSGSETYFLFIYFSFLGLEHPIDTASCQKPALIRGGGKGLDGSGVLHVKEKKESKSQTPEVYLKCGPRSILVY